MKKLACALLTALVVSPLTACNGDEEKFTPSLDKDKECALSIVGDWDNFEALDPVVEAFNEYYPNVTIKYKKIANSKNYDATLATVLEGNEKPNIFFSHPKYAKDSSFSVIANHMELLSDKALKINLDCLRPGLISRDTNNNVYAAPIFSRPYGMLVNYDLFEKEGIEVPTTLSELYTASEAFVNKGYVSPMKGYSKSVDWSSFMNTIAYPLFVVELSKHEGAIELANRLDPSAGEYMRGALTTLKDLIDRGCINVEECNTAIEDNYKKMLLHFFKGETPMLICNGDGVSGTRKRAAEAAKEGYAAFNYSFLPIPLTEQGGYFVDSPSKQFSVNKLCDNLDMTNEFMRFVFSKTQLNIMAGVKLLLSPAKGNPNAEDALYKAFEKVPQERTFNPEGLGVGDNLSTQISKASYKVATGESIDDVIASYGNL